MLPAPNKYLLPLSSCKALCSLAAGGLQRSFAPHARLLRCRNGWKPLFREQMEDVVTEQQMELLKDQVKRQEDVTSLMMLMLGAPSACEDAEGSDTETGRCCLCFEAPLAFGKAEGLGTETGR